MKLTAKIATAAFAGAHTCAQCGRAPVVPSVVFKINGLWFGSGCVAQALEWLRDNQSGVIWTDALTKRLMDTLSAGFGEGAIAQTLGIPIEAVRAKLDAFGINL